MLPQKKNAEKKEKVKQKILTVKTKNTGPTNTKKISPTKNETIDDTPLVLQND